MSSYRKQPIGRFGRMFHELKPLYTHPSILAAIGEVPGPMNKPTEVSANVPLGMIFFGQFIDHDITFDTESNFTSINIPETIENTRSAQLDMDCVFGGGPEDEPFLYKKPKDGLYLLTGKTNHNFDQNANLEKHDLPRNGAKIAIIGDPRNDENRVVSQLQLAFIRFYNAIYHELYDVTPKPDAVETHHKARELATWHYQWVVVNEFLPAMCGSHVVNKILGEGRQYYCPEQDNFPAFIPVEFSVAAYRYGHSMIAQKIQLSNGAAPVDIFSSDFGQGFTPVSSNDQIIDWNLFFDFDGNYQRAEKLDTRMAEALLDLKFIDSTNPADRSLATRNLRRGQSFLLPSGEEVARRMGREKSEIEAVQNHLNSIMAPSNIQLNAGSPLWLYLLAEGEDIGRQKDANTFLEGEGLGPVGATIVAETIIGLLELDDHSYLGSNRDWIPTYGNNGTFTMKDLLTKAATAVEL